MNDLTDVEFAQLNVIEATLRAYLQARIHPSILIKAMENIFIYSKALKESDFVYSDNELNEIRKDIEKLYESCKKIEVI